MRKRLYEIIDNNNYNNFLNSAYNALLIFLIVLSLIPLAFKKETTILFWIDKVTVIAFIIDYILRWITADYKEEKKSFFSFIKYPFKFESIIDLLSILPSLVMLNSGFKILRIVKMARSIRVFRVLKIMRYSKNIEIIGNVLKNSKESLTTVCALAGGYIIISALIIYNVEPDTFKTFFDAIYWATVSLTTVGYGDIYPVSTIGRVITMVSSLFGVAIVALPSGIITAGYMEELQERNHKQD